jgi:hypothetical protein
MEIGEEAHALFKADDNMIDLLSAMDSCDITGINNDPSSRTKKAIFTWWHKILKYMRMVVEISRSNPGRYEDKECVCKK